MKTVLIIAFLLLGIGTANTQELSLARAIRSVAMHESKIGDPKEITLHKYTYNLNGDTVKFINVITIDNVTYRIPNMDKLQWFETRTPIFTGDTLKVVLLLGQIKSKSGAKLSEGSLSYKNGYYVVSKNKFLDRLKKPISSLYEVFDTLPGFW